MDKILIHAPNRSLGYLAIGIRGGVQAVTDAPEVRVRKQVVHERVSKFRSHKL